MVISVSISAGSENPGKPEKTQKSKELYEVVEGCRLVYGPFAITSMAKILKGLPKDAALDILAASLYGATMVVGTRENLAKLRAVAPKLTLGSPWIEKIGAGAAAWVESAKVGTSSSFMLYTFTGFNALKWLQRRDPDEEPDMAYPRDPDDMTRCRSLLEAAPEYVAMMPSLAGKSPQWTALVTHWDAICACMDQESPDWRTPCEDSEAPKTAAMMRALLESPRPSKSRRP